jgi:hypothetical protein
MGGLCLISTSKGWGKSLCLCDSNVQPLLEAKVGYFFFTDSNIGEVYDRGGLDVQISGTYPLWKWLQAYGSVEFMQREGHHHASIWEIPLSFGFQPVLTLSNWIRYYFTGGARYFFVHQTSSFYHASNNGLGVFVNTGFHFIFKNHFLMDVFGEYSYKNMQFNGAGHNPLGGSVNVGGFAFGGGVGYAF